MYNNIECYTYVSLSLVSSQTYVRRTSLKQRKMSIKYTCLAEAIFMSLTVHQLSWRGIRFRPNPFYRGLPVINEINPYVVISRVMHLYG